MFFRRFTTPRTFLVEKILMTFFVGLVVFVDVGKSKNTIFEKSSKIDVTTHDPLLPPTCRHVLCRQSGRVYTSTWWDVWIWVGGNVTVNVKNVENRSTLKNRRKKSYRTIFFPYILVHPRDQAASNDVMMTSIWRHVRPQTGPPIGYQKIFWNFKKS